MPTDGTGWEATKHHMDGDPVSQQTLRDELASLESKFAGNIRGQDLYRVNGRVVLNSDLDLGGHNLWGARNVPTGIVNIRSYGVLGDGSTADWAAIQAAIQQIGEEGYRLVLFPAGTYLFQGTIQLPRGMSVQGTGPGAILRAADTVQNDQPLLSVSGDNCWVKNLTFVGNAQLTNRAVAIGVSNSNNITIENVFGQAIGVVVSLSATTGAKVESVFASTCRSLVRASDCRGLGINACTSRASELDAIDVSGTQSANVRGCDIRESSRAAVRYSGVTGGVVQGYFTDNLQDGVSLTGCSALEVIASIANDNGKAVSGSWAGVRLTNCTGCSVNGIHGKALDVSSRQSYGVYVDGGSGCNIYANSLIPNRGPDGSATGDAANNPEFAVVMTGPGHKEFANYEIVI